MSKYVKINNKQELDTLMDLYTKKGWKWKGGEKPKDFVPPVIFPCWISFCDRFVFFKKEKDDVINLSLEQAKSIISHSDEWKGPTLDHFFSESCFQIFNSFLDESLNQPKPSPMSRATKFLRNLTLSADDKLLREMGLEDECGQPTVEGYDLSDELSYQTNRARIIEIAKQMKEEADAQK